MKTSETLVCVLAVYVFVQRWELRRLNTGYGARIPLTPEKTLLIWYPISRFLAH